MGYIKEPDGVDFLIQSDPLTDKERKEISEYISNYKANMASISKAKDKSQKKQDVSLQREI